MSAQRLTAFEQKVVAGLAHKAKLAAAILDAWAGLQGDSAQSVRSLIDNAQLGVTEEGATRELLEKAVGLGLLKAASIGYRPNVGAHTKFQRIAFALNSIDFYLSAVHKDATIAQVVLTKPPRPSTLEEKLSGLGWRTTDLDPTDHAFTGIVQSAQNRVVVMTPFFDEKGAAWLRELFSNTKLGVERILILRSLENLTWKDYPKGYDVIATWLKSEEVRVFNYSIPRVNGVGRETFHAKVVLSDRKTAYLGSSNLNAASLEYSMELGVVLQGRAAGDVAVVIDAVLAAASPL